MKHEYLSRQCEGVDSPSDMGTTGLVSWALTGDKSLNRWQRFLKAKAIIESRHLSVSCFSAAIRIVGKRNHIDLLRFHRATLRLGITDLL